MATSPNQPPKSAGPRVAPKTGSGESAAVDDVTIELSEVEARIYKKILAACKYHQLNTVVRVAGGWVRDKVLGKSSSDIDLALDDMKGEDFAFRVNDYLESTGEKSHKVATIRVNPDQSKHLETAKFRIDEVEIDVNNLRSETYTDSRIPVVEMGTPLEDALRRDFTVNALYYNISTSKVEDYTGLGIDDLRKGLIRTPLPPKQTFIDDPLRVLRAARFAGKLMFRVVDQLAEAARSREVQEALRTKVSRERFGIEVGKMIALSPRQAFYSFQLLADWGLRPVVFELPSVLNSSEDGEEDGKDSGKGKKQGKGDHGPAPTGPSSNAEPESLIRVNLLMRQLEGLSPENPGQEENKRLTNKCLQYMEAAANFISAHPQWLNEEQSAGALLSSFLLPLSDYRYQHKKRSVSVLNHIVLESVKLPGKLAKLCVESAEGAVRVSGVLDILSAVRSDPAVAAKACLELGKLLKTLKEDWVVALVLAAALSRNFTGVEELREWTERRSGIAECWKWKALLNGQEVGAALCIKGPSLGVVMQEVAEWQLVHPQSTKEECMEWLLKTYAKGGGSR